MGKTCKLGNKKVIRALMIVATIVVAIIGGICINSNVVEYVFIEQTEEQIGVSLQNEYGISWLFTAYRWLCCGTSILFLIIRFCRNIKLRNKNVEEIIMSYPIGRKQIITKEIFMFGYGIVLPVLAFVVAGVFMGIETIKNAQVRQLFESTHVVVSTNQGAILWCMEMISVLVFFMAWHYLCEIVCVERMVGFFFGAMGIVFYNVLFFVYEVGVVGFMFTSVSVMPKIIVLLIILLFAMILFGICIWLYQKIDYSKGGWFYFDLPKYFFVACVCLLPMAAVTSNVGEIKVPSSGMIFLTLIIALALNYLAASQNLRKSAWKLLLESGKTIVVGCVLVFAVLNYEPVLCAVENFIWATESADAVDGQWETYESTEFVNWVQDEYKGEQECKDGLAEMRNKGIDSLIPQEMERWKLHEGGVNWSIRGTTTEMKYDGYYMSLQNDKNDCAILYCSRINDKAVPNQVLAWVERLEVIADEEYGTLIVTSDGTGGERTFISFCKYYEGKEYYDSYTITGEVPEEELLTIVHSLK